MKKLFRCPDCRADKEKQKCIEVYSLKKLINKGNMSAIQKIDLLKKKLETK